MGSAPQSIDADGRVYLRRDLWSDADVERILHEGRADQSSTTADVLAAQLRGHKIAYGAYYIELEPNLELAHRLLAEPQVEEGTPSQPPRVERGVIGTDTRVHSTPNNTYPNTTISFTEIGCSGVRIGARTVYTAGHCVYDTITSDGTSEGFICRNGSTASSCTNWPRWRFGVEDGNAFAGWTANACHWFTVPNAFLTLTGGENLFDFARWDYAAVDLQSCSAGNTGWLGTWIASDSTLQNEIFYLRGYPGRATCPSGSVGSVGNQAADGGVANSDCPGTGAWPGSTWRYNGDTTKPFSGAEIWTSSDSNVGPGAVAPSGTISTTIDVTGGNSGSGLYFLDDSSDRLVVGVASSAGPTVNRFNRWTSEVYNFFVANSDFPEDTQ